MISRDKIHIITNDCVFAMAGMYENRIPPFDLFSFGESACRSPGDLKQRLMLFCFPFFPQSEVSQGLWRKTNPTILSNFCLAALHTLVCPITVAKCRLPMEPVVGYSSAAQNNLAKAAYTGGLSAVLGTLRPKR